MKMSNINLCFIFVEDRIGMLENYEGPKWIFILI